MPGESDLDNNVLQHRVEVRRDSLRVLLVEGRPRWEYRALKPVLERDDTLQLETYLQAADLDYASEDRTALRSFPATNAQFRQYDVIVWGDVDLAELDRDAGVRVRDFVREHGGGLLLIAGEEHNPLGYAGTPLEPLLPISLLEAVPFDVATTPRFRLARTLEGKSRSWLRLADAEAEDELIWNTLPAEIDWLIATPQVKPGASVLATGPPLAGTPAPLIVHQRDGQGQILYHGTDSLWTCASASRIATTVATGRRRSVPSPRGSVAATPPVVR